MFCLIVCWFVFMIIGLLVIGLEKGILILIIFVLFLFNNVVFLIKFLLFII